MKMPDTLSQLRPYKSFILAEVRDGVAAAATVSTVLDDIAETLSLNPTGPRRLVGRGEPRRAGELTVGFLHYVEERPAPWTTDPKAVDRINNLVFVCRRKRHLAICLSDPRWRAAVTRQFGRDGGAGLAGLRQIAPGILNAAFVKGTVRTLWLSGTHRRISVKPDAKILSGIDLRDALDPLSDQSYYFTAARCISDAEKLRLPIGVSPRGSRIWAGATAEWVEFRETLTALLAHLEATQKPTRAPLPVVAVPSIDPQDVKDPFDLSLSPPELLADDPSIDDQTREEMERWAYRTYFNIIETQGANATTEFWFERKRLGTLKFVLNIQDPERVTWEVDGEPESDAVRDEHGQAVRFCKRREWLKIWFDSGHTLSDGGIFELRHRDMPFGDFQWADLSGIDVTKEKPDPLTDIGKQDSLFCWTQRNWPNLDGSNSLPGGWLACDDGAMEIADFIHLDISGKRPVLSLIHAKGAGSDRRDRGISVSKYEVVTGQAVKNARALDRLLLQEGLSEGLGKKISKLVWHDRKPATREEMIEVLAKIGANYQRRAVVLQPHVTKTSFEEARNNPKSRDTPRLRQLDTLLLSAEASCHGLGAYFDVVGER